MKRLCLAVVLVCFLFSFDALAREGVSDGISFEKTRGLFVDTSDKN